MPRPPTSAGAGALRERGLMRDDPGALGLPREPPETPLPPVDRRPSPGEALPWLRVVLMLTHERPERRPTQPRPRTLPFLSSPGADEEQRGAGAGGSGPREAERREQPNCLRTRLQRHRFLKGHQLRHAGGPEPSSNSSEVSGVLNLRSAPQGCKVVTVALPHFPDA